MMSVSRTVEHLKKILIMNVVQNLSNSGGRLRHPDILFEKKYLLVYLSTFLQVIIHNIINDRSIVQMRMLQYFGAK